jgi:hypothetical protein
MDSSGKGDMELPIIEHGLNPRKGDIEPGTVG